MTNPTWKWPLPPKWNTVTQPFNSTITGLGHHAGVDIQLTKLLVPIYAMHDGTVVALHDANDGPAGVWLMVESTDNGYTFNVQHLDHFAGGLKVGDAVQRGQVLAWTGSTGRESGLNAHFGICVPGAFTLGHYSPTTQIGGSMVNPLDFVGVPS